jgi:ribosomal protein L12E/L44/L45/RPP1/RPP2
VPPLPQTVLGVEMADDEMKLIYQHIIEADQSSSRAKGVTMNALKAWWISDTGVAHDDECDFRRALRLRGVFTACKSSLLNLADPTASHLATRQLFQRINVVCDYHQEGRDRVTMDNLKVLCEDLGIEVDQQQLKRAVNEMDSTKMGNVFVGFHPFEEWWLHGAGMERDAEVSDSTVVHSMLRLCGLLMCAEQATVFGVWNSATSILSNEEMRQSVEKALDKISKNADHHHFDTMIERLHLASLGGMLHKEDTVELEGSSLGIFDTDHPLRQFCVKVVTSVEFELFILTCIFINILALTLFAETKTSALTEEDADVGVSTFFQVVNLTVAVIFTLEMIAR